MGSESSVVNLPGQSPSATAARAGVVSLALLSLGHFCVDLYSTALGAFQPVLVTRHHLSLAQAGLLGGALVFSSSLMQPVYGFLSDKLRSRLFAALAPAVAALFISALGIAPSYGWLFAMVLLGGAGIAAFHPQASARAIAGLKGGRGQMMAIFISAGSLGMALGPAYFSNWLSHWGSDHVLWAAAPGFVVAALLFMMLPPMPAAPRASKGNFDFQALRSVWKPLTVLFFLVFIRSTVQITFSQLLPLYLSRERGYSLTAASLTLTIYLTAGAIGGFLGGHLSDRFGPRKVITLSMICSVPFLAAFFLTQGPLSVVCLALGGLILLFTIPVNVMLAQELLPSQAGTVSALMMGFAWGAAGMIFIPLTGFAADHIGMQAALGSLVVFPVLGFLLSLKIPKDI